jgi:sensor histidine kinase YesM
MMVLVFGSPSETYGYRQSLLFVLLLLPVLTGAAYLMIGYLVPRYLLKHRFFLFSLYSAYLFIAAAWMEMMIVMGLFALVYQFQMDQLNPRITDLGYLAGAMFLAILPAVAIQITRQWYKEREVTDRLKQEKLELELYAREKELDYLKEQMRPHFLFNVLNNLYGLTLEKSEKAPELVLKMSGILDYMLYGSSNEMVALENELEHINNYIDIQKIRFDDRLNLTMDIAPDTGSCSIAPMILLPFVENSFKHGVSKSASVSFVDITLSIHKNRLIFTVVNSLAVDGQDSGGHGMGLENVVKRLDLLYGDQYLLDYGKRVDEFRVELSIPVERRE